MKQIYIILLLLSFIIPSFALCPIDSGESVCSIADFKTNSTSVLQNTKLESNLNDNYIPLQPLQKENLFNKIRTPNNELMQYDSGCQFGTCVQNLNEKFPSGQTQ